MKWHRPKSRWPVIAIAVVASMATLVYVLGYFAVSNLKAKANYREWSFDKQWEREIYTPMAKVEAMATGKLVIVSGGGGRRFYMEP